MRSTSASVVLLELELELLLELDLELLLELDPELELGGLVEDVLDFVGPALLVDGDPVANSGYSASWIMLRILVKSGFPGLMFSVVKVSDRMLLPWTRRTNSIHAGKSSAAMSVLMLSRTTRARAGYFCSMLTGLTWSRILPTRHRWRRIRL